MVVKNVSEAESQVRFYKGLSRQGLSKLAFEDFHFYKEHLEAVEHKKDKRAMIAAAFTAYLTGLQSGAIKADKGWGKYLSDVGLDDKAEPMTEEEKALRIRRALDRAEQIRAKFKAGKLLQKGS